MNDNGTNIVVYFPALFKGWGIDAADFEARAAALPAVDRVVAAPDGRIEGMDEEARLFLAGRSEPLPGPANRQYPVPLNELFWMAGDRLDAALALVRSALTDAESEPIRIKEPLEMSRTVLLVGDGCDRDLLTDLVESGCQVVRVLTEKAADFEERPGVETVICQDLTSLDGMPGRFSVSLKTPQGPRDIRAGAVVLAGEPVRTVMDLGVAAEVTRLSDFEASIAGSPPEFPETGYSIALVVGETASTDSMARVLASAEAAAEKTSAAVYVLAAQVKVASYGLERLYGRAREAGVIFLRLPGRGPDMSVDDGRITFKVHDPVAGATLSLRPDMVVVDEPLEPAADLIFLSESWGLSLAADGYLGPDNVLFLPADTNRRGIYAVGAARGTDSAETLAAETAGVLAGCTGLFRLDETPGPRVVFDETCCAYCLSCLRICPHGAITFTSRPWHDPVACVACGLCAARCPGKALTVTGYSDRQTLARMGNLLSRPKSQGEFIPRVVMFGCRRSAQKAMAAAWPDGPVDLAFIPLPCGGKLEDNLILKAFLQGADGVMVAVCHDDNCRTQIGGQEAARRIGQVFGLMSELGANPERLRYFTLAPNQAVDFSRTVSEFTEVLKGLGPGIG